jgi:hypothetical protein
MTRKPKQTTPSVGFVKNELTKGIVNDSLGTVDPADTTDADPKDDSETGGKAPKGDSA